MQVLLAPLKWLIQILAPIAFKVFADEMKELWKKHEATVKEREDAEKRHSELDAQQKKLEAAQTPEERDAAEEEILNS